jgi:tetratricopeptide (TPR) repeat protein
MVFNPRFWISMAVFQLAFGFVVFAFTRQYYLPDTKVITPHAVPVTGSASEWLDVDTQAELSFLQSPGIDSGAGEDPAEMSRRADEFFSSKQYDKAADLYQKLLALDPNNAEIYNNLGITLHYLGRSAEAIHWLNEGLAVDPEHQRTWLTLGFVNSQLGNIEEAREALTTATKAGDDASIRNSALKMLEDLPR